MAAAVKPALKAPGTPRSPPGSMRPDTPHKTVSFHADTKPPSDAGPSAVPPSESASSPSPTSSEYAFVILDYLMIVIPVATVHAVLDVLVYRQYSQELDVRQLLRRFAAACGVLFVLHAAIHPMRAGAGMQMVLMLFSMLLGTYLVAAVAEHDYFAVMKQAPPLGTLLVWLAIEMEYYWSILAAVTVTFVAWCVRL
ncbi:uncharacterized protein V1518DRAFT_420022 [Limtongia smithiae]|uniref:uncharacterized protein n=1 Tax=Limtongia smithiae TaxID=1125753 RepID=UPI0034CE0379